MALPDQRVDIDAVATTLIDAYDGATTIEPISSSSPAFEVDGAYAVLDEIGARRRAQGWLPVGRKIGFTNPAVWEILGIDRPMWAHVWTRTLVSTSASTARVSLDTLVQPRIEAEVVVKLRAPLDGGIDDPIEMLRAVEWMAAGYEIVQCHFPGWRFSAPDAIASFGLHGLLVVGDPVTVDDENRAGIAARLADFEVELSRDGDVVARGQGRNVLGSPALALAHLARVLADQGDALGAGEIVTTGTVTDAQPIAAGETWSSTYGDLGVGGLTVTFT